MKSLQKGQKLPLTNELPSKTLNVAFNWNQANISNYDIDLSILLIGSSGKLEKEENFVFYNNLNSPCNSTKINSTPFGSYKKTAEVNLSKIPSDVSRLVFVLTIDNGDSLNQRFGEVKELLVDILDQNKNVVLQYKLDGLIKETALMVIEVYLHNGEWRLLAKGEGFNAGLDAILAQYGQEASKDNTSPAPTPTPSSTSSSTPINHSTSSPRPARKTPSGATYIKDEYNKRISELNSLVNNAGLASKNIKIVIALDLSVSMTIALKGGTVESLFDRMLPFSAYFDDNVSIDIFPFNDEAFNHSQEFNTSNRDRFIQNEILFKYHLGESCYAPVINKIANKYANAGKSTPHVYVLFITDGDCLDSNQAENAMRDVSSKGIFWQFVGIGGNKNQYAFLNKLDNLTGRKIDNANFAYIQDLNKTSDNEFYKLLFTEFPKWYKEFR